MTVMGHVFSYAMVKTSFCCHDDVDSGVSPASSSAVTGLLLQSAGSSSAVTISVSVTVAASMGHVVLSTTALSTGFKSVAAIIVVAIAGATVAGSTVGGATVAGAAVSEAAVAGAAVAGATVAGATVSVATVAGENVVWVTVAWAAVTLAAVTVATVSLAVVTTAASAGGGGSMRRLSLPYSELMKENPLNSSWLMALMIVGSIGVKIGSSDVKSLSKLFASVRDFCKKKVTHQLNV